MAITITLRICDTTTGKPIQKIFPLGVTLAVGGFTDFMEVRDADGKQLSGFSASNVIFWEITDALGASPQPVPTTPPASATSVTTG